MMPAGEDAPMPIAVLALAFAAAASPAAPPAHHFGRQFVSPMGEPFLSTGAGDSLQTWFNQADTNHDGVLTSQEMQADAERFFATLDTNHDGEIDPDEITHYELDIAPRGGTGLLNITEPVISADTNFNRGVSLEEFRQAALLRFQALDLEHQGRLTVAGLESIAPAAPSRRKYVDPSPDDNLSGIDPAGDTQ